MAECTASRGSEPVGCDPRGQCPPHPRGILCPTFLPHFYDIQSRARNVWLRICPKRRTQTATTGALKNCYLHKRWDPIGVRRCFQDLTPPNKTSNLVALIRQFQKGKCSTHKSYGHPKFLSRARVLKTQTATTGAPNNCCLHKWHNTICAPMCLQVLTSPSETLNLDALIRQFLTAKCSSH